MAQGWYHIHRLNITQPVRRSFVALFESWPCQEKRSKSGRKAVIYGQETAMMGSVDFRRSHVSATHNPLPLRIVAADIAMIPNEDHITTLVAPLP